MHEVCSNNAQSEFKTQMKRSASDSARYNTYQKASNANLINK